MSSERVPLEIIALRAASLRALADLAVAEAAHAEAAAVAAGATLVCPAKPPVCPAPVAGTEPAKDLGGPVTTWRGVCAVVGVSEDTLARRRKERPALDLEYAYFADQAAAQDWFRRLCAPVAPQPLTRSRGRPRKS